MHVFYKWGPWSLEMLLTYESFAHFIDHLLKPLYLIAYVSMSLLSLTKQDEIYSEEPEKIQNGNWFSLY